MTVRVYLSRSRRCPLKVFTWIVSIAGRRPCPAVGSISSRLFLFFTSVALIVTYHGRDLQQMMDRILKALHPNMCIKPATIVEGCTQCRGQPDCLPRFNMLYFAAITLTESDGLARVNWPPS
jgi:hypothetical protein